MGFLSDLFGGGKSESKTVQIPTLTPEQQALMTSLVGKISTGLAGPQPKAPAMSVPQTGQEGTYFNWINNLSNQKALQNLLSGQPGYEIGPEWANQYFEQSVRPTYMKEYQETALPALRTAYSGPGYWGSARAGAEAKAGSDLAYNLAKSRSELMYGEEQAKRQAIDTAYGRVPGAQQLYGGQLKEAGEYSRTIEQEKVAEDLQRFLMGEEVGGSYNPAYNPNVALAMAVLGIKPYAIGTESTTQGAGLGYGFLQSLAKGAGLAAGTKLLG